MSEIEEFMKKQREINQTVNDKLSLIKEILSTNNHTLQTIEEILNVLVRRDK